MLARPHALWRATDPSCTSTHANSECGIGVNVRHVIGERFDDVQSAAERAMSSVTLEQIIAQYRKRVDAL